MKSSKRSKTKRKRLFLSPPHMDGVEMQLIHKAFESNYIAPLGPMVDAYETCSRKVQGKKSIKC